jgi:hypothetical protein
VKLPGDGCIDCRNSRIGSSDSSSEPEISMIDAGEGISTTPAAVREAAVVKRVVMCSLSSSAVVVLEAYESS